MKKLLLFGLIFTNLPFGVLAAPVNPEKRLVELGIKLRPPTKPAANFVNTVQSGHYVYLSGHLPQKEDGTLVVGKLGKDLTVEQGTEAARIAAINMLSSLKAEIGDLNRVKRIVKVLGMVNAVDEFKDHPKVINGASDLLVSVFGEEKGKHARSAVGMGSLPFQIAVEIEMVVELEEGRGQ